MTAEISARRLNFFRMAWHTLGGVVIFFVFHATAPARTPTIALLSASLVLLVAIDISRLLSKKCDALFWRYLGFLTSSKDKRIPNTSVYFVASILATVALFPSLISMAAIINLAVGDSVALIVGTYFGRLRFRGKSLEGSIANAAVCFGLIYLFSNSAPIALVGALSGSAIELLSTDSVDDNISIPLVSAFAMWLVQRCVI